MPHVYYTWASRTHTKGIQDPSGSVDAFNYFGVDGDPTPPQPYRIACCAWRDGRRTARAGAPSAWPPRCTLVVISAKTKKSGWIIHPLFFYLSPPLPAHVQPAHRLGPRPQERS
jgi:hypothetical protein